MTTVENKARTLSPVRTPEADLTADKGDAPVLGEIGSGKLQRQSRLAKYWRAPWSSLVVVGLAALVVRLVLILISSRPFFMTDSGEYLEVAHRFYLPADRPIGVSIFYKVLLRGWHDLRMLVLGQALLGVGSALIAVLVSRLVGIRERIALVVGLAVAMSPTLLVYERTILAESLVVFLTLLATWLFLSALDTGKYGRAMVAGVTVGAVATVRTNNAILGVGLVVLSLAAASIRWRTKAGLVVALVFGAAIPAGGYGAMNFVDSLAKSGDGTFALSYFDGVSLFARMAPLTDCSEPTRPPAMRAEVCAAGEGYLNSGVVAIIWDPGPVNSAMGSPEVGGKNKELRKLALANVRDHPATVFRQGLRTAWEDLTAPDFRYPARAADAGYGGLIVERYFGRFEADAGSTAFNRELQDVYASWIRLRPVVWVALILCLPFGLFRRWRLNRAGLLAFGSFLLPIGIVAIAGAPGPRYVVPYEFVGFIAAAWLAQTLMTSDLGRRTASRLSGEGGKPNRLIEPVARSSSSPTGANR